MVLHRLTRCTKVTIRNFWDFSTPEKHASLTELRTVFPLGTYTFDFYDSSNNKLDSVSLDYSITDIPSVPVDFTYPSVDGQAGISTYPTFIWTVDPDAGDVLIVAMKEAVETIYWDAPVSMTTTSWTPGILSAGHEHELDLSVLEAQDWTGPGWPAKTTNGGDSFACSLINEYLNEVSLLTAPGLSGLVYMEGGTDFGYSLDGGDLLYFYSYEPVFNLQYHYGSV